MAVLQYVAKSKGYVDGRTVHPGEAFTHEFVTIEREKPPRAGLVGAVKRDKKGNPITKPIEAPAWAEPVDEAAYIAALAASEAGTGDVNLDEMSVTMLKAHAASLRPPVDVTSLNKKDDIIAAIKARKDPTR